ncbi:MAG: glutamate 5-kinase [Lentisphaerae bacterium]|nr:MAG: glutamate 5-kinase [Lentisphaerota bacterium]
MTTLPWSPTQIRRIVVKVGSRLLTGIENTPKQQRIEQLISEIAALRNRYEIILVSSGAIAAGMQLQGLQQRPRNVAHLQALAAVGQGRLMSLYESAAQKHNFHAAQLLLSLDDVRDRRRHLNVRNCIEYILSNNALPIINENDTVSIEEICFGDNDRLAAMVSLLSHADLLILLTGVDGLHEKDASGELGPRISRVQAITPQIEAFAGASDNPDQSVGGMRTKVQAAAMATDAGIPTIIASGYDFSCLPRLIAGEDLGTIFFPKQKSLPAYKRFLSFFADPEGALMVDAGAVTALTRRGKSLLPVGIKRVYGEFDKGAPVEIVDENGNIIAIGYVNYPAAQLRELMGLNSEQMTRLQENVPSYQEAVHRNNMVILSQPRTSRILSSA